VINTALFQDLERLAEEWSQAANTHEHNELLARTYHDVAEDLRTAIAAYFEPELRVTYIYANTWRHGTLLTRPNKNNGHWQVQRDGFGGQVDQVVPGPNTIRVEI
jgi:hypothetical protein